MKKPGEVATEILEDLDLSVSDNDEVVALTLREANNLFNQPNKKVRAKTEKHLKDAPQCTCGTKLRWGKKPGALCNTCRKGIHHRTTFASMAQAEAAVRRR